MKGANININFCIEYDLGKKGLRYCKELDVCRKIKGYIWHLVMHVK